MRLPFPEIDRNDADLTAECEIGETLPANVIDADGEPFVEVREAVGFGFFGSHRWPTYRILRFARLGDGTYYRRVA